MKSLLFAILLFNGVRCAPTTVYICDSLNATRYHLKANCRAEQLQPEDYTGYVGKGKEYEFDALQVGAVTRLLKLGL
jgi:hypothetical protein